MNRAARTTLQISKASSGLLTRPGTMLSDILPASPLLDLLAEAQAQNTLFVSEFDIDDRTLYASLAPVEAVGWVIVMQDITQYKEIDRLKSEFVAQVSHDLKNPLNVIVGYLGLFEVEYDNMTADHQLYLQEINRQADRMMHIIQDILTLERLESAIIYEPTDLQAIVLSAISDLATTAAAKAHTIAKQIHSEPLIVNGDGAQLREVVANLIDNAIKYTPAEGQIAVRLEPCDDKIVFEVSDNGYGIPEDRQRRLFQPFYRAKVDGTEDIEGTGLGLHLAKSIIQRHGGKMCFHSVYGTGSRFGFELPPGT